MGLIPNIHYSQITQEIRPYFMSESSEPIWFRDFAGVTIDKPANRSGSSPIASRLW